MIQFPLTLEESLRVVQMAAIFVGGWWTYTTFIRGRTGVARANLAQKVTSHSLTVSQSSIARLLRVDLVVTNIGSVAIYPRKSNTEVARLSPMSDAELTSLKQSRPAVGSPDDTFGWPLIEDRDQDLDSGRFMLEPGESTSILVDFLLPAGGTYQVYSWVDCGKKYGDLFWDTVSTIDVA
jgi:hypothetical protein